VSYIGAVIAAGSAQRTWNRVGAGGPPPRRPRRKRPWWVLVAVLVLLVALGQLVWMFLDAVGA
jgi:hypothetical protein